MPVKFKLFIFLFSIFVVFKSLADDAATEVGMFVLPAQYEIKEKIEVSNLPPVRSQDTLATCVEFAFSSAIDFVTCKTKNMDCSKIKDDQRVSILGLSRYSGEFNSNNSSNSIKNNKQLFIAGKGFSRDEISMIKALEKPSPLIRESCLPFNRALSNEIDATPAQLAKQKNIEVIFKKVKDNQNDPNLCLDCEAKAIQDSLPAIKDREKIKQAFGEIDLPSFLYSILFPPECLQPQNQLTVNYEVFQFKDTQHNYKKIFEMMKKIITSGYPIVFSLCANDTREFYEDRCWSKGHAVLITGIGKACTVNNKCTDILKVHNSWGESWQRKNRDGWIEASEWKADFYSLEAGIVAIVEKGFKLPN